MAETRIIDTLWQELQYADNYPADVDDINADWVEFTLRDMAQDAPAMEGMIEAATTGDLRLLAENLREVLYTERFED